MRRAKSIKKGSLFLKGIINLICCRLSWLRQFTCSFSFIVFILFIDYAYPLCQHNRGRIVDEIDFSTEFYIDSRASMSDAEDA